MNNASYIAFIFAFHRNSYQQMTENTFNQQFRRLVKIINLPTNSDVAQKLGITRSDVENYSKGKPPSFRKLVSILTSMPNLDPSWLLLGEEKTFKQGHKTIVKEPEVDYNHSDIGLMRKMWEQDRQEMQRLREINHELTQQLLSYHDCNGKSKTA